ncbi:ArnT family glycosyltransferase [Silvanigrella paludirubra]|uniref:ArnT family glycosyltransferase n=1 Tax=Silvanigrella paludirubra TaxID=2499159 RepID=UPI0013867F2C|nr:glycosyltransferase family 39 protein [Silvanigrella paludirubra]
MKTENNNSILKKWEIYPLLILFLIIHFLWSKHFPIADVEAYYWDWSRNLSLSYFDHPGAVAWICRLGIFITQNENNLRFFVPIFNLITIIFLILSLNKILTIKNKETTIKQILYLEILWNIIPVFSMQSFILMPDFALLTCLSIVLFLSLKILEIIHYENRIPIKYVILLGVFSGLGFNSKYHMIPITFLIIFTLTQIINLSRKNLFTFLSIFITSLIITSMPTIYWNLNNKFISFIFQLNHGFGVFDFSFKNLFLYIIESSIYITPILFFYGIKNIYFINKKINKIEFHEKIILIALSPICGIFIIFLIASLFDYVAPYWISPAFLLLLPFFAIEMSDWKFNKIFIPLFLIPSFLIPSSLCFKEVRKKIVSISDGNAGYKLFFWYLINNDKIDKLAGIKLPKSITPEELNNRGCNQNDNILASLNWTWTSQLAYHLKGHPYVYNLNFEQKSYYSIRDDFKKFKNCKITLITTEELMTNNLYKIEEIDYLNVIKIKQFEKKEEYGKINILKGIFVGDDESLSTADN